MIELRERRHVYMATYLYGHPNVKEYKVPCFIIVGDKEFPEGIIVKDRRLIGQHELFRIPYEKILSVSTDLDKDWSGTLLPADVSLRGMLFGTKVDRLGLIAKGQDKEGNIVQLPILFTHVSFAAKVKAVIDLKIGEEKGITI